MWLAFVVGPVLALTATASAKKAGRWFGDAFKESFEDAVTGAVDDAFSERFLHLESKLDEVQAQNRADHGAVAKRMSAVEAELADVKDRLAELEAAVQGAPR